MQEKLQRLTMVIMSLFLAGTILLAYEFLSPNIWGGSIFGVLPVEAKAQSSIIKIETDLISNWRAELIPVFWRDGKMTAPFAYPRLI